MFMLDYKELGWWYRLLSVCLLTAGLAGYRLCFVLAIGLTAIQLVHFAVLERSVSSFPAQVRFAYLVLLLIAFWPALHIVYWIPTIGTWAQVIFGYCTLARCLSLLPWNREERFSPGLLKRTFFSKPVRGNIRQGLPKT